MDYSQRIAAFSKLGDTFKLVKEDLPALNQAFIRNQWFTIQMQLHAIHAWGKLLKNENLTKWLEPYQLSVQTEPKMVAIIMAGNIPLVGFHDLLCVLVSGNKALVKLSSDDTELMKWVAESLIEIEPKFNDLIAFVEERQLKNFDAVIATGSNNTNRYFEYYFKAKPNLLRRSRNSLAVITGEETESELDALADDVFFYFGLGCRNVSKLLLPRGYNLEPFFLALERYKDIINHNKYANNYTYHKAIFLMNLTPHLDNGFLILKQDDGLASPLSVLLFSFYDTEEEVKTYLEVNKEIIQCGVGKANYLLDFGKSQQPELWDYADGIDTIKFLKSLA
jgi:hypothetical protein